MAAPAPSRFVWDDPGEISEAGRRAAARRAARESERLGAQRASAAPQLSDPLERSGVLSDTIPGLAPRLRVVRRRRSWGVPLVLLALVAAAVVLGAPAFLTNAMRQADAHRALLDVREGDLLAEQAALRVRAAALTAAPRIKAAAEKLGMRFAVSVQYVTVPSVGSAGSAGEDAPASEGAGTVPAGR